MPNPIWITRSKKRMTPDNMTTSHVENTIKFLNRQLEVLLNQDLSDDPNLWDKACSYQCYYMATWIGVFESEAVSRGIYVDEPLIGFDHLRFQPWYESQLGYCSPISEISTASLGRLYRACKSRRAALYSYTYMPGPNEDTMAYDTYEQEVSHAYAEMNRMELWIATVHREARLRGIYLE